MPIEMDGMPEFEVNSILDSQFRRSKLHYLVDWVGYDASENSWEPAANLSNASLAVTTFHELYPYKPRPPRTT